MHNDSNRNKSIAIEALNSEILQNTQVTFAGISSDIPGLSAESINAFKRGLVGGPGSVPGAAWDQVSRLVDFNSDLLSLLTFSVECLIYLTFYMTTSTLEYKSLSLIS